MATQETKVIEATDLVVLENGQALTTSLKVAEVFGKSHKDVLEKIRLLSAENSADQIEGFNPQFNQQDYTDNHNRTQSMFIMNRDGFVELVSNFSGRKAREWKRRYHVAFNQMEEALKEQRIKPLSPLEILKQQVQIMEDQQRQLQEHEQQISKHTQDIKDIQKYQSITVLHQGKVNKDIRQRLEQHDSDIQSLKHKFEDHGPREELKTFVTEVVNHYKDTNEATDYGHVYSVLYSDLEDVAHISLTRRLAYLKKRLAEQGATKTQLNKTTVIDVIEQDPGLWQPMRDILEGYRQQIFCYGGSEGAE